MKEYPKFAITAIIATIVISSPHFMQVTPTPVLAVSANNNNSVDSSSYHSTPIVSETNSPSSLATPTTMAPSMTNQGGEGDFNAQAALSILRATQASNFVSSKTYYDISFRTATAGVIKHIQMAFPPGTSVGAAVLIEAVGIGPGTIAASGTIAGGQTLTYTVTNEVNVPALTRMRIQVANVNNPPVPSNSLAVTITTRDSANNIIDGPTPTNAYNIQQISTNQLENNAVTTDKIAPGSIEQVIIQRASALFDIPPNSNLLVTSPPCLPSEDIQGGGYGSTSNGLLNVASEFSVDTNADGFLDSWRILVFNLDTVNTWQVQSIAECGVPAP